MKSLTYLTGLGLIACLAAASTAAHADPLIADAFEVDGTDTSAGDALDQTQTDVGGETWSANPSLRFTADGAIRQGQSSDVHNGFVAYEPGSGDGPITLSLDVKPAQAQGDSLWIGMGFATSGATTTASPPTTITCGCSCGPTARLRSTSTVSRASSAKRPPARSTPRPSRRWSWSTTRSPTR